MPAPVVMNVLRRGSMYSARASATWVLASLVRARSEKICSTSCVRSKICVVDATASASSSLSTLRCCASVSSSSKMTHSAPWRFTRSATSPSFPLPTSVAPLGRSSRWKVSATTRTRAVSQSLASSASESSTRHSAVREAASSTERDTAVVPPGVGRPLLAARDVTSTPTKTAVGQLEELRATNAAAASDASSLCEPTASSVSSSNARPAAASSAAAYADSAAATPRSRRRASRPGIESGSTGRSKSSRLRGTRLRRRHPRTAARDDDRNTAAFDASQETCPLRCSRPAAASGTGRLEGASAASSVAPSLDAADWAVAARRAATCALRSLTSRSHELPVVLLLRSVCAHHRQVVQRLQSRAFVRRRVSQLDHGLPLGRPNTSSTYRVHPTQNVPSPSRGAPCLARVPSARPPSSSSPRPRARAPRPPRAPPWPPWRRTRSAAARRPKTGRAWFSGPVRPDGARPAPRDAPRPRGARRTRRPRAARSRPTQ
mmetsp:Transcript_5773/g.24042  ORF Transcript_5773/g.24042 Transcript_5773/m.24042 type:complete len:490 (+) Transcript_5773:2061-3530(+)